MRIHLIAIGGSVMHNLAIALKQAGHTVTGSDDEIFEPALGRLSKYGLLPPTLGWDANTLTPDLDYVIAGMHAKLDNPELRKALELGLNTVSYPEFIYSQSTEKERIVVAGSHGKTTTTAMIMHALKAAGKDFDYVVGAQLEGFEVMIRLSNAGPVIVIEGDEYPDAAINRIPKFLIYKADIGIITGIAWDHVNIFGTFDLYKGVFDQFCRELPNGAPLVFNAEDKTVLEVVEAYSGKLHLYPYRLPEFKIVARVTVITYNGRDYPVGFFGQHNLLNMMAARQTCALKGISDETFFSSMSNFKGASLRLEKVAETEQSVFFRDFAHSPSKVTATVAAVKEMYPMRKCIACLELHTFSSLNLAFLPLYRDSLSGADRRAVYFNPHSLEIKKMSTITKADVKDAFDDPELEVFDNRKDLEAFLRRQNYSDSALLLMSSGSFDGLDLNDLAGLINR